MTAHRAHSAVRRMVARDPHEAHRVATPLELLFDLCFVVAVAQASSSLHHGLGHGEVAHSLLSYALVFFAIWWAWMNFTWFASAYDADDVPYRLKVLVQLFGVLAIAAGVPRAFERGDFSIVTLGYLIMRAGQVAQWLRVAKSVPTHRETALRYAFGLTVIQVAWILLAWFKPSFWIAVFALLAASEMLIPIWAERHVATPWHPHHIAERYGLLTLIVLGESVLSATFSIQAAIDAGHLSVALGVLIFAEVVLLFGMWWIYFDATPRQLSRTSREAFLWGYGHLFIFAAAAAVGAGLSVCTDQFTGTAHLSEQLVSSIVGIPVAVYVLGLWAIHIRDRHPLTLKLAFVLGAVCLIASALVPWPWSILGMSAIVVTLVVSLRLAPGAHAH
jgi:low temperature requirement protein LtrA